MACKDPLVSFNWACLCKEYAATAKGFKAADLCNQSGLEANSDLDLYCLLIERFKQERAGRLLEKTYRGLVYWKHNLAHGQSRLLHDLQAPLARLSAVFGAMAASPQPPERALRDVLKARVPVAKTGIPTASTILHFMFPDRFPIFDTYTARALGLQVGKRDYPSYVDCVSQLALKYRNSLVRCCGLESEIRVIEMALWIVGHPPTMVTATTSGGNR